MPREVPAGIFRFLCRHATGGGYRRLSFSHSTRVGTRWKNAAMRAVTPYSSEGKMPRWDAARPQGTANKFLDTPASYGARRCDDMKNDATRRDSFLAGTAYWSAAHGAAASLHASHIAPRATPQSKPRAQAIQARSPRKACHDCQVARSSRREIVALLRFRLYADATARRAGRCR